MIGGDGLWVRDHQAQPLSDSQIFCRVLFFYLNGLEGMGLEAMGQLSEESRQRILNSVSPSAEALTYALVLRHLKSASLYPHFGASTVDHEHQALFGCQMPDRELLFERLQRAGLDVE
ncbi:MAG: hypothetical protein EBY92_04015 [Actinobacteria bacterium]|nr:hypothetical protein [Actinomycetota bacterium]